jgi:photosystem II stability/assembly factor-like uncharacterized protein
MSNAKRISKSIAWSAMLIVAASASACGSADQPSPYTERERTSKSVEALGSLGGVTWTPQGPGPALDGLGNFSPNNAVGGAINALLPDPSNANTLLVGTVNGGLWRTTNATATNPTWTPLTDSQPSLSTVSMDRDPGNAQSLVAGTGSFSSFAGFGTEAGLLVSSNGGTSWANIPDSLIRATIPGLGGQYSGVAVRGSTLLAAVFSPPSGFLFRSTNSGAAWTTVSSVPDSPIKALVGDPTSPSRFYLTVFGQGVFLSNDTGATWTPISGSNAALNAAMRDPSVDNAVMSVAKNGRAYIATASNGNASFVGFTDNHGASWTPMSLPSSSFGEITFQFAIAADPTNSNLVYLAGAEFEGPTSRGDASLPNTGLGSQWTSLEQNTMPHVDRRAMAFDAAGNLLLTSDGGVYSCAAPRTAPAWRGLNGNLQVFETHNAAFDSNFNLYVAGSQDNGVTYQTSPGNTTWDTLFIGDGYDVQIDTSTPGTSLLYTGTFSGFPMRVQYGSGGPNSGTETVIAANVLNGGPAFASQFITWMAINRVNPSRILIGAHNVVYESFDRGDTVTSLGTGPDSHSLVYGNPDNPDVIWAVSDGTSQVLVRTSAGGPLAPTAAPFPTGDPNGVAIDSRNAQTAYAIARHGDVFKTTNAGASWSASLVGTLETELNAGQLHSVEFIRSPSGNLLLVGGDRGVFATSADSPGAWQVVGTTLPHAPVWQMQHQRVADVMTLGTLGRSVWSTSGLAGNKAPTSLCKNLTFGCGSGPVTVTAAQINNGSFDADGDSVSCSLSSSGGPLPTGTNFVGLVCTDSAGLFSSCAATVQVGGGASAAPWSSTTTYQAKNLVTFGGFTYEARQGSTGFAPTLPNASPPDSTLALWEIITPCGITPWLDETHYQVGSMVTFQGTTYTCIQDNAALSTWTPVATPALWRVATSSDRPICPCPP